jgi:hypothetical protein
MPFLSASLLAIAISKTAGTAPSIPADKKAQVMVLGTYHMANPGLDLVKTKIRDVLSAERQKEISDVLSSLKRFKPTKIAVESTDPIRTNERYRKYLTGELELGRDERDQLAFRLAKLSGLDHLETIDTKLDMNFDPVFAKLGQVNKPQLEKVLGLFQRVGPMLEELDEKYTVGQVLAVHNSDNFIALGQQLYMELLPANDGKEFPGADMLGDWYKRNLRIFSNLQQVTAPGDRVLVLFGSGHVKYLRDIIRDSAEMTFVSPMTYLPKPPADFRPDFGKDTLSNR